MEKSAIAAINWFSIPECDDVTPYANNAFDLGNEKAIEFNYSIREQNENELQGGTFTISANVCQKI